VILGLLCCIFLATASVPFIGAEERADDESYIIVFNKTAPASAFKQYVASLTLDNGVEIIKTWEFENFRGVNEKLSPAVLKKKLEDTENLELIEENAVVRLGCISQSNVIWNIQRLSYVAVPQNDADPYNYPDHSGEGVTSFIIDTGINTDHEEFLPNRASFGVNTIDTNPNDCNGHGTHVAGTVAGIRHGVAKKTNVVAVKVLNCGGSGTVASVVGGVEWVTNNRGSRTSNANMSLGGGNSLAMVQALQASIRSGVTYIVAAGNSNADACNYSPANTPEAISCGATDIEGVGDNEENRDVRVYFSNFGRCVHVFAPGTNVVSAWIGGTNVYRSISGTSMAAPHVAGKVSLLQAANPGHSPAQIKDLVIATATRGIIVMRCTSPACDASPNLLLHSSC